MDVKQPVHYIVIIIGITVVMFLFNTSRPLKAIEFAKKCAIFLKKASLRKGLQIIKLVKLFFMRIKWSYIEGCYRYVIWYNTKVKEEYADVLSELPHAIQRFLQRIQDNEGSIAMRLGCFYGQKGKYLKAKDLYERAHSIKQETGNRPDAATCCDYLAVLFDNLGQLQNSKKYMERAIELMHETGNKNGIASCYRRLGCLFRFLQEYGKAIEYITKALFINKEIGDREEEAVDYSWLGIVFSRLGEHAAGIKYLQTAIAIRDEISNRAGEAEWCLHLGNCFTQLGSYTTCIQYLKKSLSIAKETGSSGQNLECKCYEALGIAYLYLGEYTKAKENVDKVIKILKENGRDELSFWCHVILAYALVFEGNTEEAITHLFSSIQRCEDLRIFNWDNDHLKVLLSDVYFPYYQMLSVLLCDRGDPMKGLYVLELGRARALTELMSAHYFAEKQITLERRFYNTIEKIITDGGGDYNCLYISYYKLNIFLWILSPRKLEVRLRRIDAKETLTAAGFAVQDLDGLFGKEPFREWHFYPKENCEDRSLFPLISNPLSFHIEDEDNAEASRSPLSQNDKKHQEPTPSFELLYKIFIAPVVDDLLGKPEILIFPDRSLNKIPFAALKDEKGGYLSETFRIRHSPSLTSHTLIQERPVNGCSDTSVLIVGDPDVVYVRPRLYQLPFARREAEMIAGLLGVQPLLGCQATKQAVLEEMRSAGLIHFAAHGDAERGEIALAPERPVNRILHGDDFVLKMSDISEVQLSAKLVVLSCCHSAYGHIRAEGVEGIARAFLGSGARSVLVAQWALDDKATEKFMGRFYKHLVCGKSASESLHQTMKWMRENGFPEVRQWAPFKLIGDNVTFDFRK